MKKMVCCVGLLLIGHAGFTQLWKEWFLQKKTQIEYLEKQIIALQVYIEVGQKGYAIYQDGLTIVGDLKRGDFDLHQNYFTSLKNVKPFISHSKRVKEITEWRNAIERIRSQVLKINIPTQHQYLQAVFTDLMIKVEDCFKETNLLTTDGHYELTDEERITALDKQHELMKKYYGFARWTQRQVTIIAHGNSQDESDAVGLKRLLDIK